MLIIEPYVSYRPALCSRACRPGSATLAGVGPEATVTPGSPQIGTDTPYGGAVADSDRIELVYTGDGDREVLAVREPAT